MNKDELVSQLTPKIHEKIVVHLVDYYFESKSEFLKGNSEQASFKSGKFVEVCRALEYIRTERIKDKINVNTTIETLRKLSGDSQPETIRSIIPRVLFAIYTLEIKEMLHIQVVKLIPFLWMQNFASLVSIGLCLSYYDCFIIIQKKKLKK